MRILIPFDIASSSKRAAEYAVKNFGPRGDVSITAVHIAEEGKGPSEEAIANTITSFYEDDEIELEVEIRNVEGDMSKEKIRKAIYRITEEMEFDTVVMGYREKSFFDDLLNESTAERVLEERGVPVVLVP